MSDVNVSNYVEQGGERQVVGGSLDVISGGDLDIESGGAFKVAGTDVTTRLASLTALTTAELEVLDGATAGTQVASKAVVADANVNTGISKVTELHIGATGSETQVTSTAAELNILDDVTATTAELNKNDLSAEEETIDSGVAISVTKKITKIDNTTTGAGAITLAAPDASMLGIVKIIEMTVDNGDVTLSLANVQGGSAATTATFDTVGEHLALVGGVSKWTVIGEGGVALT